MRKNREITVELLSSKINYYKLVEFIAIKYNDVTIEKDKVISLKKTNKT